MPRRIEDLSAGPHSWRVAAEFAAGALPGPPFGRWLRKSGLPGTEEVGDEGTEVSWSTEGRERFLRLLCGVRD